MHNASPEQQGIIDCVKGGFNVIVDAVAGSGKTTTVLLLAQQIPNKQIVLFTYNARLKTETRERVRHNGLTNIEVQSFHSFGRAHYIEPCITDEDLINVLKLNFPLKDNKKPDIVIIDEAQDMTPLYFRFVHKAITDMNKSAQLIILGDNMQCIYDFPQKGADLRFLTMADKLYTSSYPWKKLHLRTSYRITKPMEHFINEVVLGYPRMVSVKESDFPVQYIVGDVFKKVPEYLFRQILFLLNDYKADDIFILAPSVRSRNDLNPIKILENLLVKRGVPCYVPLSDDDELKDEVIKNKIVFSSFHQSKGLERKIIFVYNFDSSYFTYYARELDKSICPNTMYVAITRALERLYICGENDRVRPFSFVKFEKMNHNVNRVILNYSNEKEYPEEKEERGPMRRVTDLTRFLPEELVMQIIELCKMVIIKEPYTSINIPDFIKTEEGLVETVYELNGIAIPTIYEHRLTGRISIREDLQEHFSKSMQNEKSSDIQFMKNMIQSVLKAPATSKDYLKLSNVYSSYISGYIHKIAQIKDYTWFSDETVEELYSVLKGTIGEQDESSNFEHTLEDNYDFNGKDVLICGRADIADKKALWELKCVHLIKSEHIIQLALYAWLWQRTEYNVNGARKFLLHNIRTGEVQELRGIENLNYIADMILSSHFRMANKISDEEFLAKCNNHSITYTMPTLSTMKCLIIDD
jgi:hypothetical protein